MSKYTLIFLRLYAQSLINGGEGGIRKERSDGIAKKRAERSFKRNGQSNLGFTLNSENKFLSEVFERHVISLRDLGAKFARRSQESEKNAYGYASFFCG